MVFTNTGVQLILSFLNNSSPDAPSHIGIGSSNTSPSVSDTTLGTEEGRYDIDTTTSTVNSINFTYLLPTTALNSKTLKEVGLFNAASSGTMLSRNIFTEISKTTSLEVEFTLKVEITNG